MIVNEHTCIILVKNIIFEIKIKNNKKQYSNFGRKRNLMETMQNVHNYNNFLS